MARLSKRRTKLHEQAEQILKQDILSEKDKEFVFENWHEGANCGNQHFGAFFTPLDLAIDFALEAIGQVEDGAKPKVIDLCAGIGSLSYAAAYRYPELEIVCVEINARYAEIGKKLVPNATWIVGDVSDPEFMATLGTDFDYCYGNPPFGKVRSVGAGPRYTGGTAELKIIDVASQIARFGTFIISQGNAPFTLSGVQHYRHEPNADYEKFVDQTGVELTVGMGLDTSCYNGFKDTNVRVEIVCAEFESSIGYQEAHPKPEAVLPSDPDELQSSFAF